MTQCDKITRFLNENGSITPMEAMYELGIMRLASRINEMRKAGVPIKTTTEYRTNRDGDRVHYARYSMEA